MLNVAPLPLRHRDTVAERQLIEAIEARSLDEVRTALANGANPFRAQKQLTLRVTIDGDTYEEVEHSDSPIFLAVRDGNVDILQCLLDNGDPKTVEKAINAPLEWKLPDWHFTWKQAHWDWERWLQRSTWTFPSLLSFALESRSLPFNKPGATLLFENPGGWDDVRDMHAVVPSLNVVRVLIKHGSYITGEVLEKARDLRDGEKITGVPGPSRPEFLELLTAHLNSSPILAAQWTMFSEMRSEWIIKASEVVIGDKLGGGGYGDVYRGMWQGYVPVAVKVIRAAETDVHHAEFRREVDTWFKLRHPNVLPLLGVCLEHSPPFMMSQLMRNGNVSEFLQRNPTTNLIQLLYDMSLGLLHLHNTNLVHSDVKPENFLVGAGGEALITDFGFCKTPAEGSAGMLAKKGRPGTPKYMSPERLLGGDASKEDDVYAFGLSVWKTWTLMAPYSTTSLSDQDLFTAIAFNNYRPDLDAILHAPRQLQELVQKCWATDAAMRPTMSEVVNTLLGLK
ncbi:hypothetical protein HDU93_002905 [Gonapodya sp. JEL0774]|nr:hypothetical protein HDU93_002905 [Gonapodya sp. JEL0774]